MFICLMKYDLMICFLLSWFNMIIKFHIQDIMVSFFPRFHGYQSQPSFTRTRLRAILSLPILQSRGTPAANLRSERGSKGSTNKKNDLTLVGGLEHFLLVHLLGIR